MALLLLILGIAFNVFLATLVAVKHRDKTARALIFVAIGLVEWEISNFMADTASYTLLWNRLSFVGPLIVVAASYVFVSHLRNRTMSRFEMMLVVGGSTAMALICLTGLVVPSVTPRYVGGEIVGYNPERGALYVAYLAWLGLIIAIHLSRVFKSVRKAAPTQRAQMSLVRVGSIGAFIVPVVTNVLLPNLYNSSASAQYVPLMSLVYMGALTIAVMKHKMLDIQDILLRATAFSFTTIMLGVVYVAPGVLLILWLTGSALNTYQVIIAIVIGTVIAVNYGRIYSWFVRVTNTFFFRDNYEPTELVSDLNRALLSTTDVEKMFASTARVVGAHLKSDFCYFVVTTQKNRVVARQLYGQAPKGADALSDELIEQFDRSTQKHQLVSAESQDGGLPHHIFEQYRISVVSRLQTTSDKRVGYMVVGQRKSGKAYATADQKVLGAISNTLAIAIQDALHYEQIKSFNATLQSKVNEATDELRASNKKLKELDESKDEFISMASHQLRTPLTTVKGYISMLLDGDVGKVTPDQRKLLEEAFSSSQRMVYLIGDFLNVSRLQTGKFELELHDADLAEVVRQEVDQMQESARSRGITISYEHPGTALQMTMDENKIRQVIMNFLDNALYYSPTNTTIEVSLTRHSDRVSLRVRDYGIGVPTSERHRLFAKFYRASNAKKQRPDGTGIGLFMARKVVAAHGGSIIFESQEGKGSTFGFRLPQKPLKD